MAISNQLNSSSRTLTAWGISFSSNVGIIGYGGTSSAAAGSLGQVVTATREVADGINATSNVVTNIVSIQLPPGQWLVTAGARVSFSAVGVSFNCGISTISGQLPTPARTSIVSVSPASLTNVSLAANPVIITTPEITTVYISGACFFSTGAASLSGSISALLVR